MGLATLTVIPQCIPATKGGLVPPGKAIISPMNWYGACHLAVWAVHALKPVDRGEVALLVMVNDLNISGESGFWHTTLTKKPSEIQEVISVLGRLTPPGYLGNKHWGEFGRCSKGRARVLIPFPACFGGGSISSTSYVAW